MKIFINKSITQKKTKHFNSIQQSFFYFATSIPQFLRIFISYLDDNKNKNWWKTVYYFFMILNIVNSNIYGIFLYFGNGYNDNEWNKIKFNTIQ